MNKIDELIEDMKQLHQELNTSKPEDINIDELKKLKDFTQGYALDVQELIYGFQEMKENNLEYNKSKVEYQIFTKNNNYTPRVEVSSEGYSDGEIVFIDCHID